MKTGETFRLTKEQPYNRKHDLRLFKIENDSKSAVVGDGKKRYRVREGDDRIVLRHGRARVQRISKQEEAVDLKAIWGEMQFLGITIRKY